MMRCFVDTNVFLRYLTDDVPEQASHVEDLLRKAKNGELTLVTSALVVAEIVWTLESYYGLPKDTVANKVTAILNTPGLEVEHAHLIAEAVVLYAAENVDYADAFNACWMREHGIRRAYTFDQRHFARFGDIVALLPGDPPPDRNPLSVI
ncbi:MAG: PIN domain-containing protein [Methanothrix sp.]|nr:PIN domain-containing protein [Methanothrix sp.]MBC7170338.1 PIN domain-containing protein [Candidatus Bipolaricaulota bacterium]